MREAVERLERDLTCGVCLELLRDTALLPCAHRFCRACCAPLARCPLCQAPLVRRALAPDPLCDSLAERARELRALLETDAPPSPKRVRRTAEEERLDALRTAYNAREAEREKKGAGGAEWSGGVVLACTGLDEDSQALAEQLVAARPRSVLAGEWTPQVTHTLCGTDQEGRARRTLKYLCCLAAGGRAVGPSWLRAWRAAGQPPAAAPHAVAGDTASAGGPLRAMQQGRPLLAGVAVGLAEPLETSREALLAVLDAAGAVRADERHEPSVVLCARAERASVASFPRAAWLHPAWLLDSAAAAQELPRDEYGSIVVEEEREEVEEEEGSASLQLSD